MGFTAITNTEIAVKKPIRQSLMQKIKDNFDYLISSINPSGGVINGDFEIDSDADGKPDNWSISLYPGGSQSLDTTNPASGSKCLKFVHPGGTGNGGGYADSDYIPFYKFGVVWVYVRATASCKNIVEIRYFDKDKVYLGSINIDGRTDTPTTWTPLIGAIPDYTSAKYIKIRLIGGYTDTNVAASIYFDGVGFSSIAAPKFFIRVSFSQTTISSMSYTDVWTGTRNIPLLASYHNALADCGLKISVPIEGYCNGYDSYYRVRVGSQYGKGVLIPSNISYQRANISIYMGSDGSCAGDRTLGVQACCLNGGNVYVRKLSAFAEVSLVEGGG